MNRRWLLFCGWVLGVGLGVSYGEDRAGEDDLGDFLSPPRSCRPEVWFHCGGTYSKDGIKRDLSSMGRMGLGRAWVIMPDVGPWVDPVVPLTGKWMEYFDCMVAEGRTNGVELGFHNCPGWSSSGGPWITPENSMKRVVAAEKEIAPGEVAGKLPLPQVNRGFYRDIAVKACAVKSVPAAKSEPKIADDGKGLLIPLTKVGDGGYAVVWSFERAFVPTAVTFRFLQPHLDLVGEIEGSQDGCKWRRLGKIDLHFIMNMPKAPKIVALNGDCEVSFVRAVFRPSPVPEWQGGKVKDVVLVSAVFATAPMFADADLKSSADKRYAYVPPAAGAKAGPAKGEWLDLTDHLRADGTLDWSAPASSSWMVLRIGYTSTGKCNAPAVKAARGLECDKLSSAGLSAHWPGMPAKLLARPGAAGEVTGLYIDSWEVGGQNWTENFAAEFARRRGYSLMEYLPVFAGYTVGSPEDTSKVLFDIQLTVGELIRENYYRRMAKLCHENHLECAFQGYGGPFDPVKCIREADSPEGEFWLGGTEYGGTLRLASSAAHLTGKRGASAESFTTDFAEGRFAATPDTLLNHADRAYVQGITHLKLHSWMHQPFGDVKPGYSLWRHGSMFGRNLTWAKELPIVLDAFARSEYLLTRGKSANEYFAFAGDSCPASSLDKGDRNWEAFAAGYNYDLGCVEDVERFEGGEYRAYFTGFDLYPRLATLRAWHRLVKRGAKVFGPRPKASPSLADDPAEWTRECAKLWDAGLVVEAASAFEGLKKLGIEPQVRGRGNFRSLRRRLGEGDVYFVLNWSKTEMLDEELSFETSAPAAKMYDAVSGKVYGIMSRSSGEGRRAVRVKLLPARSTFIVFGRDGVALKLPVVADREVARAEGVWRVTFSGGGAREGEVEFAKLDSWSDSTDERIRYFSGRAVYRTELAVPACGKALTLDLGEVREIASLKVNGRDLGTRVRSPYRFAIPDELRSAGKLALEVEVVNNWPNRMIGDAIQRRRGAVETCSKGLGVPDWVAECRADSGTGIYTWNNYPTLWQADDAPVRSGLMGPVRVLSE